MNLFRSLQHPVSLLALILVAPSLASAQEASGYVSMNQDKPKVVPIDKKGVQEKGTEKVKETAEEAKKRAQHEADMKRKQEILRRQKEGQKGTEKKPAQRPAQKGAETKGAGRPTKGIAPPAKPVGVRSTGLTPKGGKVTADEKRAQALRKQQQLTQSDPGAKLVIELVPSVTTLASFCRATKSTTLTACKPVARRR